MKQEKYLFIDRDGTLIVEPPDEQIDSIEKLEFMPYVFSSLTKLQQMGYKFVMVSNQDGLGTEIFPVDTFNRPHTLMLNIFKSQGIEFKDIRICPHFSHENCDCRKPKLGLVMDYLVHQKIDMNASYVIGDRDTDAALAKTMNLPCIQFGLDGISSWLDVSNKIINKPRYYRFNRKTKETDIEIIVNLDKEGDIKINSGINFFNHMLEQIVSHAGINVTIDVKGDIDVDDHHTIEDTAIGLATAIKYSLGDKQGIGRYGFVLPMDEARAMVALDLSGRSFCKFKCRFNREKVGDMATEMVSHFFRSFADGLQATLHIEVFGDNAHHMCEAAFKCLGRALRQAIQKNGLLIPSTKGVL